MLLNDRSVHITHSIGVTFKINCIDRVIPEGAKRVLQMGNKFSLAPKKPPIEKIIVDIEHAVNETKAPESLKDEVRRIISNHLR